MHVWLRPSGQKDMVKTILQYLGMIHSPNLHQLFILTWSTDATWWFVSLTYISLLSDHGEKEMSKSMILIQYLWVLLHQIYTNCSSGHDLLNNWCHMWFVSLTYISLSSDRGQEEMVTCKSILQYLLVLHSPNLHHMFILTWSTDIT